MVQRQTWQARRFKIFESARHFRIESGRPIRIRIESQSFAGPYEGRWLLNHVKDQSHQAQLTER